MEGDREKDDIYQAEEPGDFSHNPEFFDASDENEYLLPDRRPAKQKIAIALVILLAFIGVFFAFFQLAGKINNPFVQIAKNSLKKSQESCPGGNCQVANALSAALALKNQDTDKDGLSDYDETYIYKTSSYLPDTDGDGLSDKAEADSGSDPNCPGKGPCFASNSNTNNANTPVFQTTPPADQTQNITPDTLRQMLLASGIPADQVAAVSDADLLQIYQQLMSGNGANAGQNTAAANSGISTPSANVNLNGSVNGNAANLSASDLVNLSGAQIRAMLIEQGAPADVLSQVSDDQLKQMFLSELQSRVSGNANANANISNSNSNSNSQK